MTFETKLLKEIEALEKERGEKIEKLWEQFESRKLASMSPHYKKLWKDGRMVVSVGKKEAKLVCIFDRNAKTYTSILYRSTQFESSPHFEATAKHFIDNQPRPPSLAEIITKGN